MTPCPDERPSRRPFETPDAPASAATSVPLFGFDAFSPREVAERIEVLGVAKARLPLISMGLLAMLAGAYIGFGSLFFLLVTSDPALSFAAGRVLGGLVFSLGLLTVVVAGAELFTGNNLLAMAWADGRLRGGEVLRNWAALTWDVALVRGLLCNVLVCLAVWMAAAGRSVVDKAVAVVPPVTAFVALGFEHSVANFFFFPLAVLLEPVAVAAATGGAWP